MSKRSRATADSAALDASPRALELEPGEEVRLRVAGVRACLGEAQLGVGTLFVTTERVAWLRAAATAAGAAAAAGDGGAGAGADAGVSVRYPAISLHAVCRDPEAFAQPCILCQLDAPVRRRGASAGIAGVLVVEGGGAGGEPAAAAAAAREGPRGVAAGLAPLGLALAGPEGAGAAVAVVDPEEAAVRARLAGSVRAGALAASEGEEGENELEPPASDELRFIPPPEAAPGAAAVAGEPASVGTLDAIFNAMSECAQLHPGEGAEDDDGEEDVEEGDEDDGGEGLMAAVMRGATGFIGGSGAGAGGGALSAQQAAMLARYEAMLSAGGGGSAGQFDDAEEGEGGKSAGTV